MADKDKDDEDAPSLFEVFCKDLHLSITQLIGGVVGAGVSIPITRNYWGFFTYAQENASDAIGLGVYSLVLAMVGTWFFLGLYGKWARERGGALLQFVVQVAGIAFSAWMTLPFTLFVTFTAMVIIGRRIEEQKEKDRK